MTSTFPHLHVASGWSLRHGASSPDALVSVAADLGLTTLGLTDRAYIVYAGKILTEGSPEAIVNDPDVRRLYLGEEFRL